MKKRRKKQGIGWKFPTNDYGEMAGINNSAIDTFAGKKIPSVIREIIQNSLDACVDNKKPVHICFRLDTINKNEFDGFSGIELHLKACEKVAVQQGLDASLYKNGIEQIKQPTVSVLSVHDYNTTGLTGPLDGMHGSWVALIKGTGISQKSGPGSLGSFGHGSKAPFTISNIRSIFYLSRIKSEDGYPEDRFQGKSILQTHNDPENPSVQTRGTGFYGLKEKCYPLLNDAIPSWATQLRKSVTEETGTSIFIPYTSFTKKLYPVTIIMVVANFFYAIHSGKLEVTIGDEEISKETLLNHFQKSKEILEKYEDEIEISYVKDCFMSIDTILEPDEKNAQQIQGFGQVKWFLRVREDLNKRVGLARSTGMLITQKPPHLKQFAKTKPFDMFICVIGKDGSDFLKKLENPTHDKLELDRLGEENEKRDAQKKYKAFTERIRDIINRYAKVDDSTEEDVTELGSLFSDLSNATEDAQDNLERGRKLLIKDGPSRRPSSLRSHGGDSQTVETNDTWGRGARGGDGETMNEGGDIPSSEGTNHTEGKFSGQDSSANTQRAVQNFRAIHFDTKNNKARLYFDAPFDGKGLLSVSVVGEHGNDPVQFIHEGKNIPHIEIEASKNDRCQIEVIFSDSVHQMALEASVKIKNEEQSETKEEKRNEA